MNRDTTGALCGLLALFARMNGCRRAAGTFKAIATEASRDWFWGGNRGAALVLAAVEEMFEEWAAAQA